MADSDIQVGSTVRYVGFKRDVRNGAQGVVLGALSPGKFLVDIGGATGETEYCRGELELVRPPKPPTEAPTLNAYDIATDPELIESLSERVFNVLASSPKVPSAGIEASAPKPSIEAPPLNAFDLVEGPDGVIWTVGRQSDDVVELHHQLAGCCYERQRVVRKWPRKGRLGTSTQAQELRQYIASLPSASSLAAVPTDRMLRTASPVNTVWTGSWTDTAESGPGIAALDLQAPPRPRRRHQTTSWDPDMPLPDAEPGRYGWLP